MKRLSLPLFYSLFVKPLLKYLIGVSFENRNVFDNIDQYIIVANHNSHFDTIAMMAALPSRLLLNTFPVADGDYFGKTSFKAWATQFFVNTIMINRNKEAGNESAVDLLDGYLKGGRSIIIFPEGTRGRPGIMSDFKKGIAVLLLQNPQIPFIPVYLDGFGRVLPKESNLIIPLNCKVRFGKPLYAHGEKIDKLLHIIKEAILDLKSHDERDSNKFAFE